MADERKQLAGSDPRVLIDRKQKLLDEAQAEAAKGRASIIVRRVNIMVIPWNIGAI
jgi:hypothetical protein